MLTSCSTQFLLSIRIMHLLLSAPARLPSLGVSLAVYFVAHVSRQIPQHNVTRFGWNACKATLSGQVGKDATKSKSFHRIGDQNGSKQMESAVYYG
jgi:hypothetical protein